MQIVETRPENGRKRVYTLNEEPSKTVQSEVHDAEIAEILQKYEAIGIKAVMRDVDLTYRDVTEFEDFADLMRQTEQAKVHFMTLPPQLRDVFGGSVENWLDAAHDPEKLEALRPKLEKLGVMEPLPEPAPAPAAPPPVPPTEPPPAA